DRHHARAGRAIPARPLRERAHRGGGRAWPAAVDVSLMLRIPCPWCGERDHTEFIYGGDASTPWPADPLAPAATAVSGTAGDRAPDLYRRDNPAGRHLEYWQHVRGCRRWLVVERDTVSHEIFSARAPGRSHPGHANAGEEA